MLANTINKKLVPVDGLEPSHPKAGDFESSERSNNIKLLSLFFLNKPLVLAFIYQLVTEACRLILGWLFNQISPEFETQYFGGSL